MKKASQWSAQDFERINVNVARAIEREYECLNCGIFCVISSDYKSINTHCGWCGKPVKLTGNSTVIVCKK